MGLDTTHDCWHGSYSSFNEWRRTLHKVLTGAPTSLEEAWEMDVYKDQSIPINVLMNHSDCDGKIEFKDCLPLAKKLLELAEKMPSEDFPLYHKAATFQFAAGLISARARGDDVEFH